MTAPLRGPRRTCASSAAHPPHAGSDPALHRALWLLEDDRDLAVGLASEVGELDRGPLLVRQLDHRVLDVRCDLEVPHLVLDVVAGLGGSSQVSLLALASRRLGSQPVDRPAVALREQVCAQRASSRIKLLGFVPQPKEHLLHDLLRLRAVAQAGGGTRPNTAPACRR